MAPPPDQTDSGDTDSLIKRFSRPDPAVLAILDDPEAGAKARLRACRHLIRFGEIGAATTHLVALLDNPKVRPAVETLLAQCRELKALGMDAEPAPSTAEPDTDSSADTGFLSLPRGSETTVIAFTGRGRRLGISTYFMERVLRDTGVNLIFLFDWRDAFYLAGVDGLGADAAEAASGIGKLADDIGTKKLVCLGQSAGGYAAIYYGEALRADGVIAFNPVIEPVISGVSHDRICSVLGRTPEPAEIDLRQIYLRSKRPPVTRIVFGADAASDRKSAEYMGGDLGVSLQPVAGIKGHAIVTPLVLSGEFRSVFDSFLQEVGPGRWGDSAE